MEEMLLIIGGIWILVMKKVSVFEHAINEIIDPDKINPQMHLLSFFFNIFDTRGVPFFFFPFTLEHLSSLIFSLQFTPLHLCPILTA